MKKITLFALAFTTGLVALAQDPVLRTPMERKVRFGVDAGVNLAMFNVEEDEYANPSLAPTANNKTAMHAGVFVDIPIGGLFSIKPQLLYSKQGSKVAHTMQSGTGSTTQHYEEDLDYIYVAPAALKLMTSGGFVVETGPMVGFLLGASQDGPAPFNNSDIKDQRKTTDFMWSGGIGYMTRIGLGIHARYNHGFSNVLNADDDSQQGQGRLQNRVMQFGLMYHFGAHK